MTNHPKIRLAILHAGIGIVDRGVEKVLIELTRQLRNEFDLTLFTGGPVEGIPCRPVRTVSRHNAITNFIYRHIGSLGRRILTRCRLDPAEFEKLVFCIRTLPLLLHEKFDIIMTASGVWGAISGHIAKRITGATLICRTGGWIQSACETARWHPDAQIVDNPDVAQALKTRAPSVHVYLIPNGIDLNIFYPAPSPITVDLEKPIFLCVGWFEPVKRLHLAIEAVSKLPSGSLILLGDGALKNDLTNLAANRLGNRRFLTRSVSFSEVRDYYNLCDVFTLPSSQEAFGLVYLEALACNKPVVAPNDNVRRLIVGKAGILCECAHIETYAAALNQAAAEDFGDIPRKQAEKFSWQAVGKQYADAIRATNSITFAQSLCG